MATVVVLVALLPFADTVTQMKQIKIGLITSETVESTSIGYSVTGGAIPIAIDRVREEHLLDNYNFSFVVRATDCDSSANVAALIDMIQDDKVDAVVGPPCGGVIAGTVTTAYAIPQFMWGFTFLSELTDDTKYPYVSTIIASSKSLGYGVIKLLEHFEWNRFAIVYIRNSVGYCENVVTDVEFESAASDTNTYQSTMVYKAVLNEADNATYYSRLQTVKDRARVIAVCMPSGAIKRRFFARVQQLGMATDDYVYIILELRSTGFGQAGLAEEKLSTGIVPFWVDISSGNNSDGLTDLAKKGASKALVIDLSVREDAAAAEFNTNVIKRITGPPLYCNTTECRALTNASYAGLFARSLHDAFYLYARTLNKTLAIDPIGGVKNASVLKANLEGTFYGMTGEVVIKSNGARDPFFFIYGLDSVNGQKTFINISVDTSLMSNAVGCIDCVVLTPYYTDEATSIWATRANGRPLAIPRCGFSGNSCPREFWETNGVFIGIGIGLACLIAVIGICVLVYTMRERRREIERLNSQWLISFRQLEKPSNKKERQSLRSLSSTGASSTSTKLTRDSELAETSSTAYFFYNKELVVATKHGGLVKIEHADTAEFRKMRALDHENLNRFIGLSLDGPQVLSMWRHCSRGTITQIIERGTMQLDSYFVFSLIRDIVHGLDYLHSSFLGCHGNLTSSACLVDDRWQVKLSDFGLRLIRVRDKVTKRRMLWLAPELIRDQSLVPTRQSDVFSFAIISSEILTRKQAWNVADRAESLDELVYMIKKGGVSPPRPVLAVADGIEVNAALLHLIRDCWSEKEDDRPAISQVKSIMRSMVSGRQQNLMDHVFNMMEQYAGTLEEEVVERTKELVEEKKKSDVLLYRMLPRQVAEKLKLGQSVEPESYESVTIFFSDVVKFTQLSQKCTPIQIVNLLNELYTSFDTIIENHGVYKVETIGDGYLCVSGLPHRNGTEHVRDISEMALDFMAAVRAYRVPHLPAERVALRIGMNTGPCVAGVVGLTMPRYCLFGDTVNTGSRMESNGKSGMIHMSADAHKLLAAAYPSQYNTQSRGDVIIKGKGVMETFWLLGRVGESGMNRAVETPPPPPPVPTVPVLQVDQQDPSDKQQLGLYEEFLGQR